MSFLTRLLDVLLLRNNTQSDETFVDSDLESPKKVLHRPDTRQYAIQEFEESARAAEETLNVTHQKLDDVNERLEERLRKKNGG